MFTGIIQSVGTITKLRNKNGATLCAINPFLHHNWKAGESVSINGICSTIVSVATNSFHVAYMPHTVSLTTIPQWKRGLRVNVEPSLKVGDEISGHFVMGHIDGIARIIAIKSEAEQTSITVQMPHTLLRYSIPRGSISLDGVSLTIAEARKDAIIVRITPYTLAHTTLRYRKKGDFLNVEIDTLVRTLLWKPTISKRKKRA